MTPPLDLAAPEIPAHIAPTGPLSLIFFMPSMDIGGAEIAMVRLAAAFAATGQRVALVTQCAPAGASIALPVGVELVVLGIARTSKIPFTLARFAWKFGADAIVSALPHNNLAAIAAGMIARMQFGHRLRVVVTEHAPVRHLIAANRGLRYRTLPLLQRLLYPRAHAVVCASSGIAAELQAILPGSDHIHRIFNPIVAEPDPQAPSSRRTDLGGPPRIVAAGRMVAEKDFATLLRAFALVRAREPARLLIAGDGPERHNLAALAAELGIADDLEMAGFRPDLAPLLRSAAVFVLTSRFEGFGNVIVEALACGTPVVATDCPVGPREILADGRFGTLVAVGDAAAIATAIAAALHAAPDRAALRARAAHFKVATSRAAYETIIRSAMPKPAPPSHRIQTVAIYMHDLSSGGVERGVLNLIGALRAGGLDVTLLVHSDAGVLRASLPPGLNLVSFGTARTITDLFPLIGYLRRHRPDILLANLDHNNLIAALATGIARLAIARFTTKLIIVQHNALSQEVAAMPGLKYRLLPAAYRLLARATAGIVAVSAGVADDLSRSTGIARDRITVIANPVVDPSLAARAGAPLEHDWLGARSGPPLFVTAGRLVAQKDHETLIHAFAIARRRRPMRLAILGDGPLRPALQALIAALDLTGDVLLPGYVANPLPWFAAADAFVLSSRYEGFGNVLVEAMACGTPVISTDCPHGPGEILGFGRYGTLVPPGDAAKLAAALDSDLRLIWPAELLRARAAEFSVATAAQAYRGLFDRVRTHAVAA